MFWEFTSAITPSAIGGTSVAILYVAKEGISVGRSSAMVMATSFLDEVYFLIMFPLLLLLTGGHELFTFTGKEGGIARSSRDKRSVPSITASISRRPASLMTGDGCSEKNIRGRIKTRNGTAIKENSA